MYKRVPVLFLLSFGALYLSGATAQEDKQTNPPAAEATGRDKAEIAVEAFDQEDAGPKENWFGCPPVAKGDEPASEASDDCDPTEPMNQGPQEEDRATEQSG